MKAATAVWLTAREVAERLKISRSAAFELVRKLPRLKMGRVLRVSEEVLDRYLLEHVVPGAAPQHTVPRRLLPAPRPSTALPRIPLTRPRDSLA